MKRPFIVDGRIQEAGSVVDLPTGFAAEMEAVGKVEQVADAPAAPPGPLTTASVPELVRGRRRKQEQTDA